jgi:hypothetical protein
MYWPSAIGKDAFMVLGMGVTSYGAACLLSNRVGAGLPAISIGFVAMCMVRPHIALVASGGLLLASLVRRSQGNGGRKFVGVTFALLSGLIIIQTASSFFGIDTFNRGSVQKQITETSLQTADGGSEFSPVQVNSPADFPLAAVTVLYRPMPMEANSTQVVLTSIEDVGLAVLTLLSLRRILVALRHSRDYPYFMYCVGALLVFIIAFSGFSNFGLLARQRAVIQPLLLVFLSLPKDAEGFLSRRTRGPNRTASGDRGHTPGTRVPRVPALP